MSDRADLERILNLPDDDSDGTPADGPLPRSAAAAEPEAEEDELPLSPEELVAESVRQDREARGEAEEDEDDDADDEDDDEEDDEAELREKARRYDELVQNGERNRLLAAKQELDQDIGGRMAAVQQHYANEWQRLRLAVWRDAQNAPDPDQYFALHIDEAKQSCERGLSLKVGELQAEYRAKYQHLAAQAQKPQLIHHLIAKYELPNDPRVVAQLMRVSDPNRLEERANELHRMHLQFLEMGRLAEQNRRDIEAQKVKLTQPHPTSSAAAPRRRKPVEYASSGPERRKQLAAILAMDDD